MRRLVLAVFLLCFTQAYAKDPIPAALLNAKTALVKNSGATDKDFTKFCEALKKWGRFELAADGQSADIVIWLSTRLADRTVERPGVGGGMMQTLQVPINTIRITSVQDGSTLWSDETPGSEKDPRILVNKLKNRMKNE